MASEEKTESGPLDKTESISEKKIEVVSEKKTDSGSEKITEVISEKITEVVSGKEIDQGPEERTKTDLLDPLTAVRLVWALTGGFSRSTLLKKGEGDVTTSEPETPITQTGQGHYTNINADEANTLLGEIVKESKNHSKEKKYIGRSVIAMRAALRNLETIYNGRELSFKENDVLRKAHLASIEKSIEFGKSFKDFGVLIVSGIVAGTIALGTLL